MVNPTVNQVLVEKRFTATAVAETAAAVTVVQSFQYDCILYYANAIFSQVDLAPVGGPSLPNVLVNWGLYVRAGGTHKFISAGSFSTNPVGSAPVGATLPSEKWHFKVNAGEQLIITTRFINFNESDITVLAQINYGIIPSHKEF